MMMDAIALIQAVIRDQLRGFYTAELGIVTATYPHASASDSNNYACDVRLRDCGLELKKVPVCTARIGAVAIPNVDDMVLVQFLHGDIHAALITGRLYNDVDRPPEAQVHEWVYESPDPAESGIRRLHLAFPNGNTLTLDDDKLLIEMGETTLTLNNGGDIELATSAGVSIQAQGDATLEAGGNLDLSASGDVTIKGMNVTVKADASATLEGSGSAKVKGSSLTLAGQTQFSAA